MTSADRRPPVSPGPGFFELRRDANEDILASVAGDQLNPMGRPSTQPAGNAIAGCPVKL
jgi:hypothetical protein